MTGKRIKLSFIEKNAARKACFRKRKAGLIKKVLELSTLCGVDACAIICSHGGDNDDEEVETWPPSPSDVLRIVSKFRNMSETARNRNMLDQDEFIAQRIKKLQEKINKLEKENRRKEVENLIFRCLEGDESLENLGEVDIRDMEEILSKKLQSIKLRMNLMKKNYK